MNKCVEQTIERYAMLQTGDSVLVGLSGGADSVCLCHLLCQLQETLGITVRALHVNHGIRGTEADRDEAFCKAFCAKLSIPFSVERICVPAECAKTGEGEEACARRLRYAAFQKHRQPNEKVATAHTASDNAETVLLHLARGTGLRGLCGIPPVRDYVIRPLLFLTREDTEAYCKAQGLSYVTDSTNLSEAYARNRMRKMALPALKTVNPEAVLAISRTTQLLNEEEQWLTELTQKALKQATCENGLSCTALQAMPRPLALRVIREHLTRTWQMDASLCHIEAVYALLNSQKQVTLPGKHIVYCQNQVLCFSEKPKKTAPLVLPISLENFETMQVETPVGTLQIEKQSIKDLQFFHKDLFPNALDCAKIGKDVVLRGRMAQDTLTHPKRKVRKTLKKWMNEAKIPAEQREAYPVLANDTAVLWVAGFGADAAFLPTKETKEILSLTLLNGGNINV